MGQENQEAEQKPPVFKSWNGWYLLLIGTLVALIILFRLFTQAFS